MMVPCRICLIFFNIYNNNYLNIKLLQYGANFACSTPHICINNTTPLIISLNGMYQKRFLPVDWRKDHYVINSGLCGDCQCEI
jgi:hypothetical protein